MGGELKSNQNQTSSTFNLTQLIFSTNGIISMLKLNMIEFVKKALRFIQMNRNRLSLFKFFKVLSWKNSSILIK